MLRSLILFLLAFLFISCSPQTPSHVNSGVQPSKAEILAVPHFKHIVLILFENENFENVIGSQEMPHFNQLARENTLLTGYEAIRHPSLPNYIALIGGDTFGIDQDCNNCFIDAPSLPDLIEASGRSWKTYQEDMPRPCYLGDAGLYAQKHNPFVYFDPIRLDQERCERSVVPLTELDADIRSGTLPDFIFISPNLCNDAHDCRLAVADRWLNNMVAKLVPALDSSGDPYLVVLLFDEAERDRSILRFLRRTGGRIPVVFISPQGKEGFQDDTPYTHYSLLKTIAASWDLAFLGHAADTNTASITVPWK